VSAAEAPRTGGRAARRATVAALAALLAVVAGGAFAQDPKSSRAGIYTCEVNGKRVTSDRPIAECSAKEQRKLNADGSLQRIVPPTLTSEEKAEADAREREAQAQRVAEQDAIRRDRNLMARFPNEAAHRKARENALDTARNAIRISESRIKLLESERKPLMDETEFYVGKPLPVKLRSAIDANDASLAAQQTALQNQQAEVGRINALYDEELVRLKKLWAGAPAGSLGPASGPNAGAPPKTSAKAEGAGTGRTH
jgi:hypothetical protein